MSLKLKHENAGYGAKNESEKISERAKKVQVAHFKENKRNVINSSTSEVF